MRNGSKDLRRGPATLRVGSAGVARKTPTRVAVTSSARTPLRSVPSTLAADSNRSITALDVLAAPGIPVPFFRPTHGDLPTGH
jgi:hypothetical protein